MTPYIQADVANPMTEKQFEALMGAVNALADECALALMEARLEDGDVRHLKAMVQQATLFLRPPDGLEPLSAVWTTDKYRSPSKVPPAAYLKALRRCGFTDEKLAALAGCSRAALVKRRSGEAVRRPSGRIWR